MSIPGVESARRRRVSHGRSSVGFVQAPPLHRRSVPRPSTTTAAFFLQRSEAEEQILDQQAIAARDRLDERLRAPAVYPQSHTVTRRRAAPVSLQLLNLQTGSAAVLDQKLGSWRGVEGTVRHDDCPVCLDGFSAQQMTLILPCHHAFHSKCIVPWLQNHSQCPSCRAQITLL